jgi:hypothetical protein
VDVADPVQSRVPDAALCILHGRVVLGEIQRDGGRRATGQIDLVRHNHHKENDDPSLKRSLGFRRDADSSRLAEIHRDAGDLEAKHPKAVESLVANWERLITFFDFPAEHWKHLRTTNVIESPFATVRLRERATKGAGLQVQRPALMAFKLLDMAEQRWPRLDGASHSAPICYCVSGALLSYRAARVAIHSYRGGMADRRVFSESNVTCDSASGLQAIKFRQFDAILYPVSRRTSGSARKCGPTSRRPQNSLVFGAIPGVSTEQSRVAAELATRRESSNVWCPWGLKIARREEDRTWAWRPI